MIPSFRRRRAAFTETMGLHMREAFRFFLRDESGAAAAEYAMILAVVCIAIFLAAQLLGTNIAAAINAAAADV
jgi:pilus assembly protein Flp/PilA